MKETPSARFVVFLAGATILPAACAILLQFMASDVLRARGQMPGMADFDRMYGIILSSIGVLGIPALLIYIAVLGAVVGLTQSLNRLLVIEVAVFGVTIAVVASVGPLGMWIAPPMLALLGWAWRGEGLQSRRFPIRKTPNEKHQAR